MFPSFTLSSMEWRYSTCYVHWILDCVWILKSTKVLCSFWFSSIVLNLNNYGWLALVISSSFESGKKRKNITEEKTQDKVHSGRRRSGQRRSGRRRSGRRRSGQSHNLLLRKNYVNKLKFKEYFNKILMSYSVILHSRILYGTKTP